jgi:hypothetical protein
VQRQFLLCKVLAPCTGGGADTQARHRAILGCRSVTKRMDERSLCVTLEEGVRVANRFAVYHTPHIRSVLLGAYAEPIPKT